MNEHLIIGPPGTGKTWKTTQWVADAVKKFGPTRVLVSSFTKASAIELVSRLGDVDIDPANVGTLHAVCYRASGRSQVAEGKLKEWNEAHPLLTLENSGPDPDESNSLYSADAATGNALMQTAQRLRALMVPRDTWPDEVANFQKLWDDWKTECGYVDFTDMIENALEDSTVAPGNPTVGFFDEAQDLSKLELALVRKWARAMEFVVLVGDADQCLYGFKGADPRTFIRSDLPEGNVKVLEQSYRVPAAVHCAATNWIERCDFRFPAKYLPREEEGACRVIDSTYKVPYFVDYVLSAVAARDEGTHMILASCGYMLHATIRELRVAGVPFHNPYRTRQGAWNPLRGGADRLFAFLAPQAKWGRLWTWRELWRWVEVCSAKGTLNTGMKSLIQTKAKDAESGRVTESELHACFGSHWGDLEKAREAGLELHWLQARLSAKGRSMLTYAMTVLKRRGLDALKDTPKVIVGTIHSVKGGQADHVWLIPDLSRSGYAEWNGTPGERDGIRRMFYVGMTRARKRLTLLSPASAYCADELVSVV